MQTQIATPDLIAALEDKLPEATMFDRQQLRKHKAACKQSAAARRAFLRDLLALSDAELAEKASYDLRDVPDGVSCPMSKAEQIENALRWLRLDRRKTMTIADNDLCGKLLAWSANPRPETVCG